MHRSHFRLIVGVLVAALSLTAVGGALGGSAAKPKSGGTVVFGADQEPNLLNTFITGGDHLWAGAITNQVLVGSFVLTPAFVYKPVLISRPVKVQTKPFRLTYYIKKNAKWYEAGKGVTRDVTSADYIFTWHTIMDKRWEILGVTGYEDIASAKAINKKTVQFTFKTPFAGWQAGLFNQILPAYALAGEDFNKTWINNLNNPKTNRPIANGPFYLTSWQRGRQAELSRNPSYTATRTAYLNKIVVRFLADTNTTAQQIRGGEVDVIYPQPQAFLVPLRQVSSLRIQVGLGPVWEHLDINMGYKDKGDPLLKKRFVREALMRGLNRQAIINALYHATGIAPSLGVLNSGILVSNQKGYKPHWGQYPYSLAKAKSIMQANGCTLGGDGIFSCAGAKATLRLSTTAGNALRVLAEEIMQAQWKQAGFQINIVNDPGRLLFDERLPAGNYDLAQYAWSSSPDVTGWNNVYGCRDDAKNQNQQNRQGYCNPKVDKLLTKVNQTFSVPKQVALTNQALALMAKDIVIIPLFQKPTYLIHKRIFRGLKENPTSAGPWWNTEFWWKTTA
jgi:peptide/nickel transport system substrate-binding protein